MERGMIMEITLKQKLECDSHLTQAFSQNSVLECPFSTQKLDKYATNTENRTFLVKMYNFG